METQQKLTKSGFAIMEDIYSAEEVEQIIHLINQADTSNETFRKSRALFAVRQFLKEIPATKALIFNDKLKSLVKEIFGIDFFIVKSIYFDKPEDSNWFVSYHQDLTISVDKKLEIEGFGPWTVKQNQFAVQPPIEVLENNFTIRIHLDDTDECNGALRIVSQSHLKKIYRPETIHWADEMEQICKVKKGGVMLMKPLLLHSSNRNTNNKRRRVIHLEFSNQELPNGLNWAERMEVFFENI